MKIHFKSFFLLFLINFLLFWPVLLFLPTQFFVFALALLCLFNAYLYFFHPLKIFKTFSSQHFSPNDPWKVSASLKEISNFQNITCYKTKIDFPLSACFGVGKKYHIILSEHLLDLFSETEIKFLLSYYSHTISNGSVFFLTLLSGIIYCMNGFLFLLTYPLKYFQKNRPVNILMVWGFYLLSWFTKPLFLKSDLYFAKTEKEKKLWALFLWKLDSLHKLEKRNFLLFLAPIQLINPLTHIKWECYISLHPNIRARVKNLIGSYPP